jgi:mono/diheme cytochrome c family protein
MLVAPSRPFLHLLLGGLFLLSAAARTSAAERAPAPAIDFTRDVQPILAARCTSCHGPAKQRGGFRLDRKADTLRGGDSGPVIVPGKSDASPLIQRVTSGVKGERMPPSGSPLRPDQVALLRAWIDQGTPWPETGTGDPRKEHWAFQPVARPALPAVSNTNWPENAIDYFVLSRLERAGLAPAPEADRPTLLRRLKFDLLGLPPTPEEVAAFVADQGPRAYEKLVEKYLASPQHGERWARHWLDVVRFAESDGFETNLSRPNAWPYRDWVIRAFNEDMPYDRFIREQLAGDALGADEATGFLVAGPWDRVKSPDIALTLQQRADELHDIVSTTGSAFLGLTVGCARCHNHKFDPISQLDYYAFTAVFAGVQHGERPLRPVDQARRLQEAETLRRRIAAVEAQFDDLTPLAHPVPTLLLDADAATQRLPRLGVQSYQPGTARGQRDDPGDLGRLPTLGKRAALWKTAGQTVCTWEPRASGRFRVWLSWACGSESHTADARYLLETNGKTTEIARVDQRRFADGSGTPTGGVLWSGFRDAGVHDFAPGSRLVLRGGASEAIVTADLVLLQAAGPGEEDRAPGQPWLRVPVNRLKNVERFAPVSARFVRMTIAETTQGEPCLDELEVFAAEDHSNNVALASHGTKATASSSLPGYAIHKLAHVHDGRYGNSWSWISNERGKGWVQLDFPRTIRIDRIVWSRDREENGRYNDRTPTKYRIEVAIEPGAWQTVASSDDRLPPGFAIPSLPALSGQTEADRTAYRSLLAQKRAMEERLKEITALPMIYAGKFTAPEETHRLHRGDPMQRRERVAPAGLSEFGASMRLPADAPDQERRLAMARWIADPRHPLTARVLINRLWQHHFGTGLVETPSDFGLNGARPSHPELLDWLASEFVARGWSLKAMHRLIVLSRTYRQASTANAKGLAADAGCRLLWRYPPRRLEAEPLRDAILAVSGKLDLRRGGPGFDLFEPNSNYVKVYTPKKEFGPAEWRRMIYQSKPRMQLDDTFGSFDCPDAGQIAPKRNTSTTALQALNLLNSRFIVQQASFFAERLRQEAGDDPAAQVRRGFRLAFQREATEDEVKAAVGLVREHGLVAFCRALLNANEFLYVF